MERSRRRKGVREAGRGMLLIPSSLDKSAKLRDAHRFLTARGQGKVQFMERFQMTLGVSGLYFPSAALGDVMEPATCTPPHSVASMAS